MIFPVQGNGGCRHSELYQINGVCGLCLLRSGYENEVPKRLHAYRLLAENGNPETHAQFLAHQETVLGLIPPEPGMSLKDFRLARAQYTVSRGLFPITSAMAKAMGYQPPLVFPVVLAVQGRTELQIAQIVDDSAVNVCFRIGKGIRLILRNVRDGNNKSSHSGSTARRYE